MIDEITRVDSFNLWQQPWIDLERPDGTVIRQGIRDTLLDAHQIRGIFSTSPLEIVGIHRLLTAILQDMVHPSSSRDIQKLWQSGRVPSDQLDEFGERFAGRFDLFSPDQPFMQTRDLPLVPTKGTPKKPVTYLAPELPCATAVAHYHHVLDAQQSFCPTCCARGLVVIPAFATSGGAGIKPSINGVPPIYVLPGGRTLFESLVASLILPNYQPQIRKMDNDAAWWRRPAQIEKSGEVDSVGYLESLTFPARRVRLYPARNGEKCSRCGGSSPLVVREMTFEMGLSRPKDSPFWRDPFAAYFLRENDSPLPLRPTPGKAIWREFSSLFLSTPPEPAVKSKRVPLRPTLIDQLTSFQENGIGLNDDVMSFRCIGIRTDMKAKIFEWVDSGFNIPLAVLRSSDAGLDVDDALRFAGECERASTDLFKEFLNDNKKKGERFSRAKISMSDSFWLALAEPFRRLIADLGDVYCLPEEEQRKHSAAVMAAWYRLAISTARTELENALQQIGDDGRNLRLRFQCLEEFNKRMYGKLKKKEGGHEA